MSGEPIKLPHIGNLEEFHMIRVRTLARGEEAVARMKANGIDSCHVHPDGAEDGYGFLVFASAPAEETFDFLRPDILPPRERQA